MRKGILMLVLIAIASVAQAQNNLLEITPNITDVTIYNSSAEIHYEEEVPLKSGKNIIVFTGLTPFIVENTLNVSCSNPQVNIVTVTDKIDYIKEGKRYNEKVIQLQDSINFVNTILGLTKGNIEALEVEKGLLFKNEAIGGLSEGVLVSEIEKASAFFHKRYTQINTQLFHLYQKEKKLVADTGKMNNQLKEMTTNSLGSTSEIRVVVNSPLSQKATFKFKFLTERGGWAPIYDFKYQGNGKPLQFVFRANVFNATGIPWKDVNIKLSTANPIQGFDLPTLNSKEKKPAPKASINYGNQTVEFRQIEVSNTIAEFKIEHEYTIPSDAQPYLVEVDAYNMQAEFNYLLIPKLEPYGFLMAKIPDWNKYNLIPGTTNIYNHGTYMGKTFLETYSENDTLSLYLGKDKNIQSTRKEINTEKSRIIVGNHAVDKTTIEIVIKNNNNQPFNIEMIDQVPLLDKSDKEKMNISDIENALYNKKEGMLTWKFVINPNQTTNINFGYVIKTPKEYWRYAKPRKRRTYARVNCPKF